MAELKEISIEPEKLITVGVSMYENEDVESSLDELDELISTAGAISVGRIVQKREQVHPGTYVGKGKIEEIKDLLFETESTGVVCDDELSPAQIKNLEKELDVKVMDRTLVILDIFALHAQTSEGKIQVELAQLKYRLSRLAGLGKSLSRLGGGIGTRGPGEKKLEVDRRLINKRVAKLNQELREVKQHRELTRSQREKNNIVTAAIVGYTNAGKSTLLNCLTGAQVLEENKLFATLDPTTRSMELPGGQNILLTDTVGFIRKLPHHLIDAFKSTLEEAKYADIIIHVVDGTNKDCENQMHIVYDTLNQLGINDKTIITIFNKIDKTDEKFELKDLKAEKTLYVSAKTGVGIEDLKLTIEEILRSQKMLLERVFPYSEAGKIQTVRKQGELLAEEYRENGIYVKAYVSKQVYSRLN